MSFRESVEAMSAQSQSDGAAGDRPRVLVVDNDPEDRRRLRRHLRAEGFAVENARSCSEARERVEKEEADLLVLGVTHPDAEECALCESAHFRDAGPWVPVLAVTDPPTGRDRMAALHVGADEFVVRPIKKAELVLRARMLLRMKELHDRLRARNAELEQANRKLARLNQELAARNRELEQGIEMAHKVQDALLPQEYPEVKNIAFCHLYMPADVIGGDFFQIKGMSHERAAILVCDVSGHGIRAALVTSMLKAVFEHVYLEDKNATQIMCDVNSRFRSILGQLAPHIFATGFLVVVDGEACKVSAVSAGHPCPLLIRKRDMSCQPLMDEERIGPALGFFHSPEYQEAEVELVSGDIVLGFTDGVYELTNEAGEMYGLERLSELVARNARLIPRDLIQKIVTETDEFRGPVQRPDDVCLVAVEVL